MVIRRDLRDDRIRPESLRRAGRGILHVVLTLILPDLFLSLAVRHFRTGPPGRDTPFREVGVSAEHIQMHLARQDRACVMKVVRMDRLEKPVGPLRRDTQTEAGAMTERTTADRAERTDCIAAQA